MWQGLALGRRDQTSGRIGRFGPGRVNSGVKDLARYVNPEDSMLLDSCPATSVKVRGLSGRQIDKPGKLVHPVFLLDSSFHRTMANC